MKRRGLRLHQKFSVALFLLLFAFVIAISTVTFFVGERLTAEAETLAALPIINSLAEEISASSPEFDPMKMLQLSKRATELLPGVQLYIFDPLGYLVADFSVDFGGGMLLSKMDPRPIADFANHPLERTIPAYSLDPGSEGHKNLFVSAPIVIKGSRYYLYAALEITISRHTKSRALDRMLLSYLGSVFAVLLVIALLSVSTVFIILTRRIRSLMSAVDQYREGDYSSRISVSGSDEVSELAESMNLMAGTIEEQIDGLNSRDELRRELIANVSHDLRGPVGVLKLCAEQLGTSEIIRQHGDLLERCRILDRSAESLAKLLGKLFELAKLEAREDPIQPIELPIGELLEELEDRYRDRAAAGGIRLTSRIEAALPAVFCDPALIERALANLIENAITYTLENGSITLIAERTNDEVEISVSDTGVGIPQENLQHVFDRFYRVEKWSGRDSTSGGLGLAIVKKIIDAHGSRITVQSKENEGSRFSFRLSIRSSPGSTSTG